MDDPLTIPDFRMDRPPSPSQLPDPSQPHISPADLVKWQSTQPLPALNALLKNTSEYRRTKTVSHTTCASTSFFPDGLSSPDPPSEKRATLSMASGSRKPMSRRARPRYSESVLDPGPTGSTASPFSLTRSFAATDGQSSFVDMLKSVSKMVDENARIKKRYLDRQTNRAVSKDPQGVVKYPDKVVPSRDEVIGKDDTGPKRAQRSIKGKERQRVFEDSVSMDIDCPDEGFQVMHVDVPTPQDRLGGVCSVISEVTSSSSKMPPPPLPTNVKNRPLEVHSFAPSTSVAVRSCPLPPVTVPAPPTMPLSTLNPPTSSFSRRPVLGMRRIASSNNSNPFTPSQKSLPSKQKGFKPPFAKPATTTCVASDISRQPQQPSNVGGNGITSSSATSRITSSTIQNKASSLHIPSHSAPPTPAGIPSNAAPASTSKSSSNPSTYEDADSSYSELSFDLDILEEAMKEYDE